MRIALLHLDYVSITTTKALKYHNMLTKLEVIGFYRKDLRIAYQECLMEN